MGPLGHMPGGELVPENIQGWPSQHCGVEMTRQSPITQVSTGAVIITTHFVV